MGDRSSIQWTDATWNPIRGCSRVSEGCRNCYAERIAARFSRLAKMTPSGPRWTGEVRFVESLLQLPLRWKSPRRIFVNSMSDLFHEKAEDEWIDQVFAVMALAPQHTFQILTKRPERMRTYLSHPDRQLIVLDALCLMGRPPAPLWWEHWIKKLNATNRVWANLVNPWPLPNVWLGVSVEDQATAAERIPLLLQTPAAVRWVSYEPALAGVDFSRWLDAEDYERDWPGCTCDPSDVEAGPCATCDALGPRTPLDWIVVGGESGPGVRPFDLAWARATIAQCRAAGVPVFVKQFGERPMQIPLIGPKGREHYFLKLADRKGGDMDEWPADLRVREFPR